MTGSRTKWNQKYNDRLKHQLPPSPNKRLNMLSSHFTGGTAVDLACGLGANSFFLTKQGYNVNAYDISDVAIEYVKDYAEKKQLPVYPKVHDLTHGARLEIQENSIDLVVITYYLDRSIFPYIKSIIKENGYFFMETFYKSPSNDNAKVSTQYKLESNELLSEFSDWQVLFYEEHEQEGRQTILVRNNI